MKTIPISLKSIALFLACFICLPLLGNSDGKSYENKVSTFQSNPTFEIGDQNSGPWFNTISVVLDDRLSLWYKISLEGNTEGIRVVFPVYDSDSEVSIGKDKALMTNNEWNTVILTGIPTNDVTKTDDLPGVVDISSLVGKTEIIFQLTSSGTLASDNTIMSNTATCLIQQKQGRKWADLGDITITKKLQLPSVVSFTTERSVLIDGDVPTFSWKVVDADKIEILEKTSQRILFESSDLQSSWISTEKPNFNTDYLLRASVNGQSGLDKELPIKLYASSLVATIRNLFDNQKLMGLYNHPVEKDDKMIALIHHEDLSTPNVLVWESTDGLLWEKSNAYSKIPAFNDDERNTSNVPLEFAGSPGVVYSNKLFLIGGSRFDPNLRSNEVYFYDFGDEEKGWQKGANAGFTPRMGHSCVVFNNDIWVLGGSDAQGATNSCWTFDGSKWIESVNNRLPEKKCMASAMVVNDQIELFGGFGELPGYPDQTIKNSHFFSNSSWKTFQFNVSNNNRKYSGCVVAPCKQERFIFSTTYNSGSYNSILQRINNTSFVDYNAINIDVGDSYHNIQAVTFKDVIWMCITTQEGVAQSTDLRYFVYVN